MHKATEFDRNPTDWTQNVAFASPVGVWSQPLMRRPYPGWINTNVGLSSVNIVANCAVNSVRSILIDMTKTIQQLNYAVQRLNADFDDWDTIRETITPLEARARRLMRWKRSLRTRCKFRLVKLETLTTITPIEAET
jgi:hypothetical protein